jgi:hypothetical protein
MGAQENRAKSQATAEFMKARGIRRESGKCPWGCGATYATNPTGAGGGQSLMSHLTRCQGGAAAKRSRSGRSSRSRS